MKKEPDLAPTGDGPPSEEIDSSHPPVLGKDWDRDRAILQAIISSSHDAIITKTLDGVVRSWNPAAERMLGYTEEEAVGQSITLIIPPDRLQEEQEILARLRRGERIEHYDTVRVTKSGRFIDISLTISPIRDAQGRLIGASKIARDISDRIRADRALRESEQRFASFMRSLPGLAWIKDAQGRYVFANDAVEKPFGFAPEQLYGKTDADLFPPQTAAQFRENDERALASEQGVRLIETLEHEDGMHFSVVSKFPIRADDGQPAFIGGVAIDITDRMRAEQALMEADRRKDEFLATLAHELRNPLAPIRNSLHILRMTNENDPGARRVHDVMERQVAHMVRLVDDLLELSRISRGKIVLKKERVALRATLEHAIETSKPLIEGGGHRLEVDFPSEPIVIDGDPVRLSQVFANILNNAAKYTPQPGLIRVAVRRDAKNVRVTVSDTGIGIPAEMLSRVFDMFAQIENPMRRTQEGLGIGLSLVRTLVLMHDGHVEARSNGIGQGSEFVITLPALEAHEEAAAIARTGHFDRRVSTSACRILAVDDNRDSADSMAMMLRFLGADVHVAYDGNAALEAVRILRPAIVLMDLGMPAMDGLEVARRIRSEEWGRNVVLIALTGWGQEEDRSRSREAGFDHHLVKPVDLSSLQTLLASCTETASR